MCSYLTLTTDVTGSGLRGDEWFDARRAVVYFDHPQEAPLEHALCIDVRGAAAHERVSVELDEVSARRLAETILAVLDDAETRALTHATPSTRSS